MNKTCSITKFAKANLGKAAAAKGPVVQEPSLPQQSESTTAEQKPAEVRSKSQTAKVLAAICVATLIAIISIGVFLKYGQPKTYSLDTPPPAVGCSVEKSPDKTNYNRGETVTLEAVANRGTVSRIGQVTCPATAIPPRWSWMRTSR